MPHATATFNGKVIAETDHFEFIENNIYFPPDSVDQSVLIKTDTHYSCPWKGVCSQYSIKVDGQEATDAAWYYPDPKEAAKNIKDHIAFYKNKIDVKSN